MANQKAFLVALVCCLLIGCGTGLTPYAKSIGIKDEKEIDGMLQNYMAALALFARHGVLTTREGVAEYQLEYYRVRLENKSKPFKRGYLNATYREFPEAQDRRRLCRLVDYNPAGIPEELECKGIKLSALAGAELRWQKEHRDSDKPAVLSENEKGDLPPRVPSPSESTYTVFGPDGKMQICSASPASLTVFCY